MSAPSHPGNALDAAASTAARRAAERLAGLQFPDGHWRGDLTADDPTPEADYILFQVWLSGAGFPACLGKPAGSPHWEKAVRSILSRQAPDGGFSVYADGPSDVSASVKAYAALKLGGVPAGDPRMERLRHRILELGGVQAANSYVKIQLSLFGLYPRQHCPTLPPEAALPPFDALYQVPAWLRAILAPLSIVYAAGGCRQAPEGFSLDEIRLPGVSLALKPGGGGLSWSLAADRVAKWWGRNGSKAIQRKALATMADWMTERQRNSDGLGVTYQPTMYAVMALDALGYAADDPLRVAALRQFNRLLVDDGTRFFLQPAFTPVWDTAIAAYVLARSQPGEAAARNAAGWLVSKEILRGGDWRVKRPGMEPSGWAFGYANEFYPSIDCTAMALLALSETEGPDAAAQACRKRAAEWLLAMQRRDGGWAAFDAGETWGLLRRLWGSPAGLHGQAAYLDNSCADITGHVLEALGAHGIDPDRREVRRGVEWLVRNQEPDGSWYGRWGVAYIYGTCFALRGLAAAGESDREAHVLRAGEWLRSVQNADGGWGESCASYGQGSFAPVSSTPSQTAWAILGLLAGGDAESLSVRHGIAYLTERQRTDGGWEESRATGTGLPGVFHPKYHMYKDYFPLLALSAYAKACQDTNR